MFDRHDVTDMVERITCGVSRNLARRSMICGLVGAGVVAAVVTVLILRCRAGEDFLDEGSEHEWDGASPPESFPDTLREEDEAESTESVESAPRARRKSVDGEGAPQPA